MSTSQSNELRQRRPNPILACPPRSQGNGAASSSTKKSAADPKKNDDAPKTRQKRVNPIIEKTNDEAMFDEMLRESGMGSDIGPDGLTDEDRFIAEELPPHPHDAKFALLGIVSLFGFMMLFMHVISSHKQEHYFHRIKTMYVSFPESIIRNTTTAPYLVKGLCNERWTAFRHWNPSLLQRTISTQPIQSYVQKTPIYTFADESRPLAKIVEALNLPRSDRVSSYGEITTKISTFWKAAEEDPTLFTYSKVNLKDFPNFLPYVKPSYCLKFNNDTLDQDLWMTSSPNTVSYLHYDMQHNYFTQVHGKKRFLLFPPEMFHELHTYPETHPRVRQSQISNLTGTNIRFPDFNITRMFPLEIVLSPGETLYIPPFWFHEVTTLSSSISISSCTKSLGESTLQKVEALPIPFESSWSDAQMAFAAVQYAKLLVKNVDIGSDFDNVTNTDFFNILRGRFDTSLQKTAEHTTLTKQICGVDAGSNPFGADQWVSLLENWNQRVAEPASLFNQVQNTSIRRIILWTYVESFLNSFAGVDNLHAVLTFCF